MDIEAILNKAHAAASNAIKLMYVEGRTEAPGNCGFAWVRIEGNSPMARACRKANGDPTRYGDKGQRGWVFWKPGKWPTRAEVGGPVYEQDMDFHLAGANAFLKVLGEHGIRGEVGSRLD